MVDVRNLLSGAESVDGHWFYILPNRRQILLRVYLASARFARYLLSDNQGDAELNT